MQKNESHFRPEDQRESREGITALELQKWLYEHESDPEFIKKFESIYRRFVFVEKHGKRKFEQKNDFSLRDFTVSADREFSDANAFVVSYKGIPAFNVVEPPDVTFETGSPWKRDAKTQLLENIEKAQFYSNPNYQQTGFLPEVPAAWYREVEGALRRFENDKRFATIQKNIGESFSLANINIRQAGSPTTSIKIETGEARHLYSITLYYKGRSFLTIGSYLPGDTSYWIGDAQQVAESLFSYIVYYTDTQECLKNILQKVGK